MTENMAYCLIVDDEPDIRETLSISLQRMDVSIHCVTAETVAEAKQVLSERRFQLCLTDMKLPDGNGIQLVEHIQQHYPHVPVAMITAYGNMESAITALKAGAFDFIAKPVDLKNLRDTVRSALQLSPKKTEALSTPPNTPMLMGNSPPMLALKKTIQKLARSQAPAYISGESGTGKELVARLIHAQGPRANHAFVPVNCGAIPRDLMESEFFGHKKGSFTGAVADKQGLFQVAQGGTLFLDEVADLPLDMQVKLLRAIQEKHVRPVGGQKELPVDVRILSATHKDLAELVREGIFRQDLFYRINVIEVPVPPLRERPEDIPALIDMILQRLTRNAQLQQAPLVSNAALHALQHYAFPGNVRELENILERAMTLCEDNEIALEDLHLPQIPQHFAAPESNQSGSLDPLLDNMEKEVILNALEQTQWNKTQAAKLLGVTFSTLRYRLKKLQLEKPPFKASGI